MSEPDSQMIFHQSRCVSHELRNHLSICELYSEIIRKTLEKDGYQSKSVGNALDCIKKSIKIMGNSLLDLKSLDNLKLANYDLKKLLEDGIEMAQIYVADVVFVRDIGQSVQVCVDENKFLGCVVNILKNAVEAGAGDIRVSTRVSDDCVSVKISNNGKPILPQARAEIFGEGFTTKQTGSGLGLHICRNNLALQNAELRLVQSDEKSTEFEILIPLL
jgi:signal transduction histidine kinase